MNVGRIFPAPNELSLLHNLGRDERITNAGEKQKDFRVELSKAAYKMQSREKESDAPLAADKKESEKEQDAFAVHFSHSAMASRAASRGYLTVNGVEVSLSVRAREEMLAVSREAKAKREEAHLEYVMHNSTDMAKAKRETLAGAYRDMNDATRISSKLSTGGEITPAERQKLMRINPKLYTLSLATRPSASDNGVEAVSPVVTNFASEKE